MAETSTAEIGEIVLGTHNVKKRAELETLLAPLGVRLRTLDEFPAAREIAETGETFADNARLKATEQAAGLSRWVLAEDSGIEVDAIGGKPGVYSARFAGPAAADEENNALLLRQLAQTPRERRTARYVCWMTLANPAGEVVLESHGDCRGVLLESPRGAGGFGYDPLFEIREYHQSFGEMGPAVKAAISHRARAARCFADQLARYIGVVGRLRP